MKVVFKDKSLDYEARQSWEGNVPLTIIKYRAANLKVEQFRSYYDDPVTAQTTIERLSAVKLEDKEGYDLYHFKLDSPASPVVAHRSSFVCHYRRQLADGTLNIINSSLGNEKYVEQYKDLVGRNVVANQILGSATFKPYDDGVEVTHVIISDAQGLIPIWLKSWASKRLFKHGLYTVDYVTKGDKGYYW